MLVWVCYNQGAPVPVEVEDQAQVRDLKREVGRRLGIESEQLRVVFAGRELLNCATLRSCDLPEQSTVHVVLPRTHSRSSEQDSDQGSEQDQVSLTRVDLGPPEAPESRERAADQRLQPRGEFNTGINTDIPF
ncbi:unnamed protein product [Knipowitschia caucasica]|uniref:Ubiquitin-like domain-containing protein n=1 Tax=Knipowitschia caucasica TaxID=637954 RepID=A0AAV2JT39_KNICA